MPRASRHYIPGLIWHITQRCHNRDFLLKFVRDRKRWLFWVFQAKKRFNIRIMNYMVTSNHIHILIQCDEQRNSIAESMNLISGRTAWEYNQRKARRGAFWEDRYHTTAVESESHLLKCMIYIDLNMVRAGVVKHPKEWPFSGFNEIVSYRERYKIIDYEHLIELIGVKDREALRQIYRNRIDKEIGSNRIRREAKWTESIAVGSEDFLKKIKDQLPFKYKHRNIIGYKDGFELH